MLQPEASDEEDDRAADEAEEQQGSTAQGTYRLDASVAPEVLPGVPEARPELAEWLKAQLGLPSHYKVKEKVLDKIPEKAPLAEVLERAVRRIAFTYRRGLRLCEEILPPNLPLDEVRRRLGVRCGGVAGGTLAQLVQKSGATLVGLLVPGLRHPRPHVLVGPSADPKLVQALYNWSKLEFDPEDALAFYCGFLLKDKAEGEEAGDYQLEAQPGTLVGTFRRSVWVRGDRPPQPVAKQREDFGKVLMDRQHWQWPGAFAHVANDSLQADKANLMVHENLVMTVLPDCPFPCFAEGRWWYGPDYWEGKPPK